MDYIHGLFEFAIYGGRVDNMFDNRVMVSYLKQFFDTSVIGDGRSGNKKLGPLKMPASAGFRVRVLKLLSSSIVNLNISHIRSCARIQPLKHQSPI